MVLSRTAIQLDVLSSMFMTILSISEYILWQLNKAWSTKRDNYENFLRQFILLETTQELIEHSKFIKNKDMSFAFIVNVKTCSKVKTLWTQLTK